VRNRIELPPWIRFLIASVVAHRLQKSTVNAVVLSTLMKMAGDDD